MNRKAYATDLTDAEGALFAPFFGFALAGIDDLARTR